MSGGETKVPAVELLDAAWELFTCAYDDSQVPLGWKAAAVQWRCRCDAYLETCTEPDPATELPEGEYARVEIMGHDSETGWVTDGTRAGVPVMVVRDWDGHVVREIPGHAMFTFVPLATPLKRPEPRAAIAAPDGWDGDGDYFENRPDVRGGL